MGISLTAGMRSNLTGLQNTAKLMDQTSVRLNSGKKVNSALDDPISYFTAKSHMSRATDLGTLKNGMSEGIQTINAANHGIDSIMSLIAAAKSKAESAKSASADAGSEFTTSSISLDGVVAGDIITIGTVAFTATTGASSGTDFHVEATDELTAFSLANAVASNTTNVVDVAGINGSTITFENSVADLDENSIQFDADAFSEIFNAGTGAADYDYGKVDLNGVVAGDTITIGGSAFVATTAASSDKAFQVGATNELTAFNLAAAVASDTSNVIDVMGVKGSTITFENSTADLTESSIYSNKSSFTESVVKATDNQSARDVLAAQFETLMAQIGQMQSDSGYKGINLLDSADILSVKFEGSNKLDIEGFDGTLDGLGLYSKAGAGKTSDWSTDKLINADIARLDAASKTLESKAGSLASSLSIVTTRQTFTESMMNTLTTGADNLTLADMNEEGANMLMLQTQQSLGTTSLSMAAQTAQGVLRLF